MTVDVSESLLGNDSRKESVSRKTGSVIVFMLLLALAIMVWCIHATMRTPPQQRLRRNRDPVTNTTLLYYYGSYGSHTPGTTTSAPATAPATTPAPTLAPADDTLGQFYVIIVLLCVITCCSPKCCRK